MKRILRDDIQGPIFFLLIAVMSLSLTGCATSYNEATGRKELAFFSPDQEIALGNDIDKEIREKYKVIDDSRTQARLNSVGSTIADVSDRQSVPYKFILVELEDINAFTIPGGNVYVTTGLMKAVDSNDELASVIAHEIGHVAARHPIKRIEATYGYTFLTGFALAFLNPGSTAEVERARQVQGLMNTVYNFVVLGYSRRDELAADVLGLRYMQRAGYDQRAMISFMTKLMEIEPKMPEWTVFTRSHPYMKDRIAAMEEYLAVQNAEPAM